MDPPAPYNLSEMWAFPINGCDRSGGGPIFGNDPMLLDHREDTTETDLHIKRLKTSDSESRDENDEPNVNTPTPTQHPKQDFIHVRARRGQATDSHSLAERARREKISERMKILQDLVPGCNKVIGKALVLDEIINYIQSLQRQVEFLSMKLETVNSRLNHTLDEFGSKDFAQQTYDMAGTAFGSQATRNYSPGSSPNLLQMQIGGSFERP